MIALGVLFMSVASGAAPADAQEARLPLMLRVSYFDDSGVDPLGAQPAALSGEPASRPEELERRIAGARAGLGAGGVFAAGASHSSLQAQRTNRRNTRALCSTSLWAPGLPGTKGSFVVCAKQTSKRHAESSGTWPSRDSCSEADGSSVRTDNAGRGRAAPPTKQQLRIPNR